MAIPNAKTCFYRTDSPWVYAFILMCDGSMAVWFNHNSHRIKGTKVLLPGPPGVCCWYPNSTTAMWEVAIISVHPGHFVREYLWKKLPYKIIKPPCPATSCCCTGSQIPNKITCTITATSGCSCGNGTITLYYNSSAGNWQGSGGFGTCSGDMSLTWSCSGNDPDNFTLATSGCADLLFTMDQHDQNSCSPLSVTYHATIASPACGCATNGTMTFVITE